MKKTKAWILSAALMTGAYASVTFAEDVQVIQVNPGSSDLGAGRIPSQSSQLLITVQQLQDEVRRLRGQVESQQFTIDRLENQQKERYRDLDRRISELMRSTADPLSLDPDNPNADLDIGGAALSDTNPDSASDPDATGDELPKDPAVDSADAPSQTLDQQGSAAESDASGGQAAVAVDDKADYQAAFDLVRQRQFPQAITDFNAFVTRYPQSARIPNAHYWLGELYLATNDLEKSESEFQNVVQNYPDSLKASDALYKLGILYKQKGDTAKSFAFMERVVKEYPESSAARLAESALQ
jgi:tol-pal system protein YbgF